MILIGICTYKRQELLLKALESVNHLITPDKLVEVVVIDNDEDQSAAEIVHSLTDHFSFPVWYVVEPNKGITFARNKAIDFAISKKAEHLCFFDDDAEVDKEWLIKLLQAYDSYGTIITGPQLSRFSETAPLWAHSSIYFNPKRLLTGTQIRWAATNNVLIPMNIITEYNLRFDNNLRFSGGSDQCLFMEVTAKGIPIVWCDNAIVTESVPEDRTTESWVIKRSYRYGTSGFYLESKVKGVLLGGLISCAKASYYLLQSLFSYTFTSDKISAKCYLARSKGWIAGIAGARYQEYKDR